MKMLVYSHEPEILTESWSSFLQQQQQEGEGNPPADPPADPTPKDEPIVTPFDKIDLSTLDEAQAAQIEAGKAAFIETTKANRALSVKVDKVEKVASKYQSEAAKFRNQLATLQPPQPKVEEPAHVAKTREFLAAKGMKGEELERNLPFWSDLMVTAVGMAKEEIGRDLGPMAGTVLESQATQAFTQARNVSPLLQDPEVAQEVYDKFVVPEMQAGRPVNPQAVADYAKIVFVDKGKHLNNQTQHQSPQPPTVQNPQPANAGFTFPGAQVLPPGNWGPSANNGPKPVSPDVNSAVTAVMSRLTAGTTVWPKGLSKPTTRR